MATACFGERVPMGIIESSERAWTRTKIPIRRQIALAIGRPSAAHSATSRLAEQPIIVLA